MMDRRQFLRRAGLIAAGIVAADQLDVLEMLAPRSLFAGASFASNVNAWPLGLTDVLTSSSLHGLTTTTWPLWAVSKDASRSAWSISPSYLAEIAERAA